MHSLLRQTLSLPAPACTPDRELLAAIMRSFDGPAPALAAAPRRPGQLAGTRGNRRAKIQNRN